MKAWTLREKKSGEIWINWIGHTKSRLLEELKANCSMDLLRTHSIVRIEYKVVKRKKRV